MANEQTFQDFSLLLSQLIRKFVLVERDEKVCLGVTISQCYTIETLARNGGVSMTELSREMGVAVSTMTRILDVLVREGLVTRKNSTKDRRLVCVGLTNKGRNLAGKLKRCADDYLGDVFANVPANERKKVTESLRTLLGAVAQHPSCCEQLTA